MRRAAFAVALALCLPLTAPEAGSTAQQPVPKTTLNEIEAEVMCPVCGTLLELANSPQARREKVFVAKLVAAGKSKAEVKDALVAQYGEEVLAMPEASGFDLTAYLVPILAILVAAVALAYSVMRWRRNGGQDGRAANGDRRKRRMARTPSGSRQTSPATTSSG